MSKNLGLAFRNFIVVCAMVAALACPALAGEIPCPSALAPPAQSGIIHNPVPADQAQAAGIMHTPGPEAAGAAGQIETMLGEIHTPVLLLLNLLGAALP